MIKELFTKYKDLLTSKGVQVKFKEDEPAKMTSAKLADGTEVSTPSEAWAEGVDVIGADGQPLATGEYPLESGEVLVVVDGKLDELKPAGYEDTEMSAEEVAAALEHVVEHNEQTIAELKTEKEALETQVQEKETEMQKMSKEIADLKVKVAKFSKAPAAGSVKHERQNDDAPKTRAEQIMENLNRKQQIFGSND